MEPSNADPPKGGPAITLQPVGVLTGRDNRDGVLVFVDGRLAAVLVRFDGPCHGRPTELWNLDAGFGACEARPAPFGTVEAALAWVAGRVGRPGRQPRRGGASLDGEPMPAVLLPVPPLRPNMA